MTIAIERFMIGFHINCARDRVNFMVRSEWLTISRGFIAFMKTIFGIKYSQIACWTVFFQTFFIFLKIKILPLGRALVRLHVGRSAEELAGLVCKIIFIMHFIILLKV